MNAIKNLITQRKPMINTGKPITIHPYYTPKDGWVFDDPRTGLVKEGLVQGIDTMLDTMATMRELDRRKGFDITFSSTKIPKYDIRLTKMHEIEGNGKLNGTMYYCQEFETEGWLCPALYLYFAEAPADIYIKVQD